MEHVGTKRALIDYYVALETILSEATRHGYDEYRTHFGPALGPPPEGYCWLKTSVDPCNHLDGARFIDSAFGALESRLGGDLDPHPPGRVLDVGCGAGGTIRSYLRRWPNAHFCGININPKQLASAREILDPHANRVELVQANFLDDPLAGRKFDLIYFVESAFHMGDKKRVLEIASRLLERGGRVRFVDVFLGERAARMKGSRSSLGGTRDGDSIFTYQTKQTWIDQARELGLRHDLWHEFGREVGVFLSIDTSWEDMNTQYVGPRLAEHPRREALTECLQGLHAGYRRLGRLLAAGIVEYGVLGFRR